MGLKHLPLVNIMLLLFNIFTKITLGAESLNGRLKCFRFLVKGQRKVLADFAVVIKTISIMRTWQNKQLPNVPFSHNNHKRNLRKGLLHSLTLWARLSQ
jgi:hypothetical protein